MGGKLALKIFWKFSRGENGRLCPFFKLRPEKFPRAGEPAFYRPDAYLQFGGDFLVAEILGRAQPDYVGVFLRERGDRLGKRVGEFIGFRLLCGS